MAIRPLEVKELAEVLAVDFDDAEGIPKLKPNWRWEDEEQAILTSCSSLITTVETYYSRVVQFSHFSVKEYLTSERLATSSGDISRYHIDLELAHTILAQACMGILLRSCDHVEENSGSPLAEYAAKHWVTHAQFERVSPFIRKAMENLFDLDKPYFAAWLQLYDIDTFPTFYSSSLRQFAIRGKSSATPLYYAALCGFQDLVEHLVGKYPQQVDVIGGHYVTPLFAALSGGQYRTAKFLCHDGAHVDVRGRVGVTPLHSACYYGDLKMVQLLLDHKADVNVRDDDSWTPIHFLSSGSCNIARHHNTHRLWSDIARLLLENGADVNTRINNGLTPFHLAGTVEVVRVLLEHGADIGAVDRQGRTPLHTTAEDANAEVVCVLLEHGANVDLMDNDDRTPLHTAVKVEVVRVLLEYGANIAAVDNQGRTPLHNVAESGTVEVVRALLERGVNVGAIDNQGRTPLHRAVDYWYPDERVELVSVLLEHGANAGTQDNESRTPFQIAKGADEDSHDVLELLSEHSAKVV